MDQDGAADLIVASDAWGPQRTCVTAPGRWLPLTAEQGVVALIRGPFTADRSVDVRDGGCAGATALRRVGYVTGAWQWGSETYVISAAKHLVWDR